MGAVPILGLRIVLCALCLYFGAGSGSEIEWGTYRPHALISVRARVPNSPIFGFTYHSLHKASIRHLASDHHDAIHRFSWNRHDGRDGEQAIHDADLNLNITTHFVRHPDKPAWVLRFSAEPLNDALPAHPISVVFYSATGPEHPDTARDHWTSFTLGDAAAGGVTVNGDDRAVGAFRVTVREPAYGGVESVERGGGPGVTDASRTRARVLADAEMAALGDLGRFFTSGRRARAEKAWMVEGLLADAYRLLMPASAAPAAAAEPSFLLDGEQHPAAAAVFVQRVLQAPFSIDAAFAGASAAGAQPDIAAADRDLAPARVAALIRERAAGFDRRFEDVFQLARRGIPAEEVAFAKVALSNVLGGIGFFHGSSLAPDGGSGGGKKPLPPVSLLTATPSRATFPRGFLWDEGFHQLIVQRWDARTSERSLRSWLSAMQPSGWIPREQVLGIEAQRRFPQHVAHLLVQRPDIANPPTLLMPLRVLASLSRAAAAAPAGANASGADACGAAGAAGAGTGAAGAGTGAAGAGETCSAGRDAAGRGPAAAAAAAAAAGASAEFLRSAVGKLARYFDWLRATQAGAAAGTFRWRGRSLRERAPGGYPLTLASGLDDYPRGAVPSARERHVDLQAWMVWAAGALAEMARATGGDGARFAALADRWRAQLLAQYTRSAQGRQGPLLCDHDGDRSVCHEGYVTILPFILGLLDPADERVAASLDALERPDVLFSPAGVRSLSAADPMYQQGDNYWTGKVWMPFNFLTLAALRTKYSVEEGPYKARSERLFHKLKKTILANAFSVYKETGFLWENYSPVDGSGKSGRQFTGWSSLVVLIYADMYQGVVI